MDEKELQVEYWREEFKAERKRLGRSWRSLLLNSDKTLNDDEGRRAIETVSEFRGSLIRTAKIVKSLRKLKTPE